MCAATNIFQYKQLQRLHNILGEGKNASHFTNLLQIFVNLLTVNWFLRRVILKVPVQSDSRVIMSPTELKMQPTIHLEDR
jgi:hypothetical protein